MEIKIKFNVDLNVYVPDIDECMLNMNTCAHNCINSIGSYNCSCYNGYKLEQNGSCYG